jgi:hypothetical protein
MDKGLLTRIISSPRIIQDSNLVKITTKTVERTWKERLLSWPWRPWKSTKAITIEEPDMDYYVIAQGVIVCHPTAARVLMDSLGKDRRCSKTTTTGLSPQ